MGADARMFRAQQLAFPQLEVATWIAPEPRESLTHYAGRMVERYSPGRDCFIGGASFGGVAALEMACLIQPRACILIGGLRDRAGLPHSYRWLKGMSGVTRCAPPAARLGLWTIGFALGTVSRGVLRQLSEADGRFLSWATRALLDWQPSPGVDKLNVVQIHGDRDWLLPLRLNCAERIVPQAGHLLSITHPAEVNDFIEGYTPSTER
jgi:pimeloyl-ACP methyl ester carboxylesterase